MPTALRSLYTGMCTGIAWTTASAGSHAGRRWDVEQDVGLRTVEGGGRQMRQARVGAWQLVRISVVLVVRGAPTTQTTRRDDPPTIDLRVVQLPTTRAPDNQAVGEQSTFRQRHFPRREGAWQRPD